MYHHKKTYENVFSTDIEKSRTKLNIEETSVSGMGLDEYTSLFKVFLNDFFSDLFLNCVKLSWLRRKFKYYGKKTVLPMYRNSRILNNAFVKFMRRNIGKDIQMINKSNFFNKIETYFSTFFPDFEEENPFDNPSYYKFPYNFVTMDYLITVYQMDDRIDLLKEAEDKEMSYAVFLDYVINHAFSENERLGRTRYEITQNVSRSNPYYIKDLDKKLQSKKGKKRL